MIIFVAAYDRNFGIGYKVGLPWPYMNADKDHLHRLARGKTLVLGERTYNKSGDYQKTYNTKKIFVISSSSEGLRGATVLNSVGEVLELAKDREVWVLGGGNVFAQLIDYAERMYLTEIDGKFKADTFFPKYDEADWCEVERHSYDADSQNPYPYTFVNLKRVES